MDINNLINDIESELNSINTDLTTTGKPSKITYPFMYITDVSEVEFRYLKTQLPNGDLPLMIKQGKSYAYIKDITLSLSSVKHLSRFKDREIFIKQSKECVYKIEDILDTLLLEEG